MARTSEHLTLDGAATDRSVAPSLAAALWSSPRPHQWTKNLVIFAALVVGPTIPLPLFGILRYPFVIHRRKSSGNPSNLLISDKPLLACVALWMMAVVAIVYWCPSGHQDRRSILVTDWLCHG